LYVNGVLQADQPSLVGSVVYGSDNVQIGRRDAGGNAWNGTLDEVIFFNRALSSGEVSDEYDRGRGLLHTESSAHIDFNNSLVGWWRFEDVGSTANDSSSYGNDGTVSGAVVDYAGKRGKALKFDGVDDHVNTTDQITLTTAATLEVWVYSGEPDTHNKIITRDGYWGLTLKTNGDMQVLFFDSGNRVAESAMTTNEWHHVTGVYDGSNKTVQLYIDGEYVTGVVYTGGDGSVDNDQSIYQTMIGNTDGGGNGFNGSLDEVKVWNRALSAGEVNASFNNGLYRLERNFTGLSEGNYSYVAQVVDQAGNINSSETLQFTVDTTAPTIDLTPINNTYLRVNNAFVNVSTLDTYDTSAHIDFNNSLVGWWRFEDGGVDSSSYGNDGTVSGAVVDYAGKRGKALEFDGVDDYVDMGTGDSLDITGDITMEAWVKIEGKGDFLKIASKNNDTGIGQAYSLQFDGSADNLFQFVVHDGSGYHIVTDSEIPSINQWYHVVGLYNGTDLNIYVDGVLKNTIKETFTITSTSAPFYVGARYSESVGQKLFWNGSIDEVKVWNRVLSAGEVNASFNNGLYRLERNFTGLSEGNYSYVAQIVDHAGNLNTTGIMQLAVDNTNPTFSYGQGSSVNGSVFNTQNWATFNITSTELYAHNITGQFTNGTHIVSSFNVTLNTSGFGNLFNFTELVNDTYNFSATLADNAGNIVTTQRSIRVDTNIPSITIISPSSANNTFRNSANIPISAVANDDNLFRFQINVSFEGNGTLLNGNLSDNINNTELWKNYTIPVPTDSNYSVEFSSTDDITFSPEIPNLKVNDNDNALYFFDDVLGTNLTITPSLEYKGVEYSLDGLSFNKFVSKIGRHYKSDYGIDLKKLPPGLKNKLSDFRLILTAIAEQGSIYQRENHLIVVNGNGGYYYDPRDISEQGFNITLERTGNDIFRIVIAEGATSWADITLLDPVVGGLNVETKSSNIVIDTTYPTVEIVVPVNNSIDLARTQNLKFERSDLYLNTCSYNIYNTGNSSFELGNTTIDNCDNFTIQFSNFAQYTVTVFASDFAGNVNSSTFYYSTIPDDQGSSTGGGGGGGQGTNRYGQNQCDYYASYYKQCLTYTNGFCVDGCTSDFVCNKETYVCETKTGTSTVEESGIEPLSFWVKTWQLIKNFFTLEQGTLSIKDNPESPSRLLLPQDVNEKIVSYQSQGIGERNVALVIAFIIVITGIFSLYFFFGFVRALFWFFILAGTIGISWWVWKGGVLPFS
jgi:hypothetical protein